MFGDYPCVFGERNNRIVEGKKVMIVSFMLFGTHFIFKCIDVLVIIGLL